MRITLLCYENNDLMTPFLMEIVHRLKSAGHVVDISRKSLIDLSMDVTKIAGFAESMETDAWIVVAGSPEVLGWFATQPIPAYALFGRFAHIPLAGAAPEKTPAILELADRLVSFGHRRIVMLTREERRIPTLGILEQSYLRRLESHGIRVGSYHLPNWGDTPEDLERTLGALFKHTPPTALIIDDAQLFVAVVQHLARQGIVIPDHVSLACTDSSPAFEWCRPAVTHTAWNRTPIINHLVNWANTTSRGRTHQKSLYTEAKLIPGGTIAPAPSSSKS